MLVSFPTRSLETLLLPFALAGWLPASLRCSYVLELGLPLVGPLVDCTVVRELCETTRSLTREGPESFAPSHAWDQRCRESSGRSAGTESNLLKPKARQTKQRQVTVFLNDQRMWRTVRHLAAAVIAVIHRRSTGPPSTRSRRSSVRTTRLARVTA